MVGRKEGGCATTVLRCAFQGPHCDPMMSTRMRVLRKWAGLLPSLMRTNEHGLRVAWGQALGRLQCVVTRWRRVNGFVAAAVACLLEAGWNPEEPDRWVDPDGE
eukprot:1856935-Pyramimonas_sp.AAC.1